MNIKETMPVSIPGFGTAAGNMFARRIESRFVPLPTTESQKLGLRYEKKVVRALLARGCDLEHNPWFGGDWGVCCPDVVVYELCKNRAIVIEVKLSYTPEALKKLVELYCPVVESAVGLRTFPLVICKNVSFGVNLSPKKLYEVLDRAWPIYQWLGRGVIL